MNDAPPGARGRAFVALQHLLPQHGISRLVLAATRSRSPGFKNALISLFVRGFRPDMSDAALTEPTAYASFNEFFTRALRPGTRPVDADARAIVSPVDGTVSEAGPLTEDRLLQAKGHDYTLRALLAGNAAWERTFAGCGRRLESAGPTRGGRSDPRNPRSAGWNSVASGSRSVTSATC